jgi:hypothetical protein
MTSTVVGCVHLSTNCLLDNSNQIIFYGKLVKMCKFYSDSSRSFCNQLYNGGQKVSSTTIMPLTYAVKQRLGTNSNKFQILICKRQSIKVKLHAIFVNRVNEIFWPEW